MDSKLVGGRWRKGGELVPGLEQEWRGAAAHWHRLKPRATSRSPLSVWDSLGREWDHPQSESWVIGPAKKDELGKAGGGLTG